MRLAKVVPFGRSMNEYRSMFALSDKDLDRNIVGVGDGPASFNAEMSALGKSVISVDPLYILSGEEIEEQFYSVVDDIIAQIKGAPDDWVWPYHKSPEHLRASRIETLKRFLADYDRGKTEGRYIVGELPDLRVEEDAFDLALCSHLLFLYSDHLTYDFHRASLLNLLALAPEVRLFPLLTLTPKPSPHLPPLIKDLESKGFSVSVETVGYELLRGGNEMLRIRKAT